MESKILVVDDEELIGLNLRKLLEKHGYRVDVAISAIEALEKLRGDGFNIVITDIMMPDMDGLELLKKIKERDRSIYVIMLTAYASLERAVASLKLGAGDFIQKPYRNKEILEAVEKAVETLEIEAKVRDKKLTISVKQGVIEAFGKTCYDSVTELMEGVKRITGMDTKISIEGPVVEEVENFTKLVGGEGVGMVGSYAGLYGPLSGGVMLLFPVEDAIRFVEVLSNKEGDYADFLSEEDKEVIREVGSILSEEYVKKFNAFAGMEVKITPFSLVDFLSKNLVSFLELRTGRRKQYYFLHKLFFRIGEEKQILGYLLLVFDLRNINLLNTRFS